MTPAVTYALRFLEAFMMPRATLMCLGLVMWTTLRVFAGDDRLVAWWKLDEAKEARTIDTVSQIQDKVIGYSKYVSGVLGTGLRFDGYTTGILREASKAPLLGDALTFESWIALQTYPWGLCAIVSQNDQQVVSIVEKEGNFPPEKDPPAGYFFGIDSNGRVHLQLSLEGQWHKCRSEEKIPLMKWTHVAGAYSASDGTLTVYLNGKKVGSQPAKGKVRFSPTIDLLIGKNHKPRPPEHPIRLNIPALYSIDGYLDEVKIYNRALNEQEIAKSYLASKPSQGTGMTFHRLPGKPSGAARFGAFYTELKFSETWDAMRREGPHSDIVVLFDENPWRYVFWRGTSYIPHWVTENEIWYTNEFNETWGHGALGCAEPMSDKQTRYSHVRVIENSEARVVVHWDYALIDTRYTFARVDPITSWGDWSDEYHILYPDGIGIRKVHLWSSQPLGPHEFQESIVLDQPGTRPEDNIHTEALTMVNMKGETYNYSWAEKAPDKIDKPAKANIEYINTKSKAKPFLIVSDEPFEMDGKSYDGPRFRPYNSEIKRENSIFPWWNHWPVAQIPSDGRWATEPDRVAHSSLTTGLEWKNWEVRENTRVRVMMHGLTERSPAQLAALARSWLRAAKLKLSSGEFSSEGYDPSERAYMLTCRDSGKPGTLNFEILASENTPVYNPAFIIKNWGELDATLKVDGRSIEHGKDFRLGHRRGLEGSDVLVWVKKESVTPIKMEIAVLP